MEKKKILEIGIFVLIIVAILITLNISYQKFIHPSSNPEVIERDFEKYKNETKILILGNSHSRDDINPTFLPNSYVLALPSESYMNSYYKLKTIKNNNNNIETVILSYDSVSFSSKNTYNVKPINYWKKYIDFGEVFIISKGKMPTLKYMVMAAFPYINMFDSTFQFHHNKNLNHNKGQWTLLYFDFSTVMNKNKEAISLRRVNNHFKGQEIIDPVKVIYFEKILNFSQEKNISVVLIKFPITEIHYNTEKEYIPNIEEFYSEFDGIINKYENVYILDYIKYFFENESLFKDVDHLNPEGSTIFAKEIYKDLKNRSIIQ